MTRPNIGQAITVGARTTYGRDRIHLAREFAAMRLTRGETVAKIVSHIPISRELLEDVRAARDVSSLIELDMATTP